MGSARFPANRTSSTNSPSPVRSIQSDPVRPPRYRFQRAGSNELRPITTPGPLRWKDTDRDGPHPSDCGPGPSTGTSHRCPQPSKGCLWSVVTMTRDPSGAHPATWVAFEPKNVKRRPRPAVARHYEYIESSLVPADVCDLLPVGREPGECLGSWIGGEPVSLAPSGPHCPKIVFGYEHDLVAMDSGMAVVAANCQGTLLVGPRS